MEEICFQKVPGKDLAKNGRFPPNGRDLLPQGSRARISIWLKTAVSQCSQKRSPIAGHGAATWQKYASKRLSGQDLAQNGRFPMIPEEKFNSRPRGRQMAEIASRRLPARIWQKTAGSQ